MKLKVRSGMQLLLVAGSLAQITAPGSSAMAQTVSSPAHRSGPAGLDSLLYGVAYYDEYTPVDRVEEDARMMKAAGFNVVRIAESTWGTLEPAPGRFDFSHVDRVLDVMHRHGIKVIIGTPTYAIPTWLAKEQPDGFCCANQSPISGRPLTALGYSTRCV